MTNKSKPISKKARLKKAKQKEKDMLDRWDKIGYGSVQRSGKANVHGFRK